MGQVLPIHVYGSPWLRHFEDPVSHSLSHSDFVWDIYLYNKGPICLTEIYYDKTCQPWWRRWTIMTKHANHGDADELLWQNMPTMVTQMNYFDKTCDHGHADELLWQNMPTMVTQMNYYDKTYHHGDVDELLWQNMPTMVTQMNYYDKTCHHGDADELL